MRIIAGKAKGQYIKSPKGIYIRPTSDLIRGALFSILESMTTDWSSVLDLYAGTGSMGLEALSRGAGWADFVEQNPRCYAVIKHNLDHAGLSAQAHVYHLSAIKSISLLKKKSADEEDLPEIDYLGFTIPPVFVVGYGLDYAEQFRHLPYVATLSGLPESGEI